MIGRNILLVNTLQLKDNLSSVVYYLRLNVLHLTCSIVRRKETTSNCMFDEFSSWITVKN